MSAQNDILAGLDISSLASVTQAQLVQMINQAGPISNIGFVICFDGIASGAAGVGFPDVTNNPRFVRYLWLDTNPNGDGASINRSSPVFKRYTGAYTGGPSNPSALSNLYTDWTALGVANGAVTTAMMRLVDATGGINIALLKLNSDNSATLAKAYYFLTVDSAGINIVASSLATALTNGGGVPLANISPTGLVASTYLGYSGGLAYKYLDPTADFTALIGNRIPVSTAIAPGTARYFLRTNAAGTAPEWIVTGAVDFFNPDDIPLSALDGSSSVLNDVIYYNGTKWIGSNFNTVLAASAGSNLAAAALATLNGTYSFLHGLGSIPKLIRTVLVCVIAELGYNPGDEIDASCLCGLEGGADTYRHTSLFAIADILNITVSWYGTVNFGIIRKDGANFVGITLLNWKPKVYYWK